MGINIEIENSASTVIENGTVNITMINTGEESLNITSVGIQGLPGAQGIPGPKGDIGEPLKFEDLTEIQKLQLRGDVGNTSTNYANVFYNSLLS